MAKNIKAIQCPNCGSVKKTEIKPDYFRCDNCGTEYFLDNDDININIKHVPQTPQATPPGSAKRVLLVAGIIIVTLSVLVTVVNFFNRPNAGNTATTIRETRKYSFGGDIVYQNTRTGKVVFMRLGREDIEDANRNIDYINTHVVFIDPVDKKQIKDVMLMPHIRRMDDYFPFYQALSDGTIYMLYPGAKLFTIDREADNLVEVTKTQFKNHPQLSAGLAEITLSTDYMNLLTNDGQKFYYVPKTDLLTQEYDDVKKSIETVLPNPSFRFIDDELFKITPSAAPKLSPERKFFNPEIVFQDRQGLIIATGATAGRDAPLMLQSIDINTGRIIWSLPAKTFSYDSGARCKEGFAVHYFSGSDQDYISGVLVISPEGKILTDYLIKRNE